MSGWGRNASAFTLPDLYGWVRMLRQWNDPQHHTTEKLENGTVSGKEESWFKCCFIPICFCFCRLVLDRLFRTAGTDKYMVVVCIYCCNDVVPFPTCVMWIEFVAGFLLFWCVVIVTPFLVVGLPFNCFKFPRWFSKFWTQFWTVIRGAWRSDLERELPCLIVFLLFFHRLLYSCFWCPPCLFLTLIEEVTIVNCWPAGRLVQRIASQSVFQDDSHQTSIWEQ